eukprot:31415-Pelagococcus_subviridis.AAC.10
MRVRAHHGRVLAPPGRVVRERRLELARAAVELVDFLVGASKRRFGAVELRRRGDARLLRGRRLLLRAPRAHVRLLRRVRERGDAFRVRGAVLLDQCLRARRLRGGFLRGGDGAALARRRPVRLPARVRG